MKLNVDIILYYLLKKFSLEYYKNNEFTVLLRRPMYFESKSNCYERVIIIDKETFTMIPHSVQNVVFICIDQPIKTFSTLKSDLIVINTNCTKEIVFNYLQEIFDLFEDWDNELKEICYNERGFSDLIESCDKILTNPLCLIDSEFSYVAYSKELSKRRGYIQKFVDENNKIPLDSVNEMISDPKYHELENKSEVFEFTAGEHIICKNIFDENQQYVGRITMNSPTDISYVSAIFTHLATYIEMLYQKFGSFHTGLLSSNNWHELLLNGLNQIYIADDYIHRTIVESKWSPTDEYLLIQFFSNHKHDKTLHAQYLCPQLEHLWPGSCSVPYESCIILLINSTVYRKKTNQDFYQNLAYFLRESLLSASISRSFSDLNQIYAAYNQAKIAMEFGMKKHPMFWYYRFDDYAFSYISQKLNGDFTAKQICHQGLIKLKAHDRKTGSQFYLTLMTYCMMQYNSSAAAKALFIHRSTFLGRMERIKELTQIDFDKWDELLYILISFQLLETK